MLPNAPDADNVISPDAVTVPVNVGAVRVLLVRVSVPVRDTKSSPDNAVLNSASVPETVLLVRLTVLFYLRFIIDCYK